MKSWNGKTQVEIETPEKQIKFLEDIDLVCKKYNLSISHSDHHGSFEIEEYEDQNIEWLKDATILWL